MASAASAAFSDQGAYSLCVDSTSTVVLGVDFSDLECTHLFGTNYIFNGVTGPTGVAGPAGGTGGNGVQGPTGAQGFSPQGGTGGTGVAGPVGNAPAGVTGPVGVTGGSGANGGSGLAGPQGLQGDEGIQGPVGPTGGTGGTGPAGAILGYETIVGPSSTVSGAVLGTLTAPVDAACPAGTTMVGGGGQTTHTGSARGGLLNDYAVGANTWRARGIVTLTGTFAAPGSVTETSYAVCEVVAH